MSTALSDIAVVDAGGTHELATVELLHAEGYPERMGVHIRRTYVLNGADAVAQLLSGDCDVAMQVGFGPALKAIADGAPLRIVAASNLLTVHAIYSRDPDIRHLQHLRGRTVGVGAPGALIHQLIYAALVKQGVDPDEVRFVTIGNSAATFQALLAGAVDAAFGESEVFEHQAHYGVHALEGGVLWRELPEFPNQASFALQSAIRDKREALVRTLGAHALLYRRLHSATSWDAFAVAWARALPASNADEARAQWLFYQANQPYAEDLMLPPARLDYLQRLNVAMGLQAHGLPFEAVTDMSLARDAMRLIDGHHFYQGASA